MQYKLQDNDFAIIIRAINWQEEDGTDWAGDCETAFGMKDASNLPDFIVEHVMDIATMMTTFLVVASEYPEIYDLVQERRDELLGLTSYDEAEPEKKPTVEKDGNVYKLDIWTKTKGEA